MVRKKFHTERSSSLRASRFLDWSSSPADWRGFFLWLNLDIFFRCDRLLGRILEASFLLQCVVGDTIDVNGLIMKIEAMNGTFLLT